MNYEYKMLRFSPLTAVTLEDQLNNLAKDGWKLVPGFLMQLGSEMNMLMERQAAANVKAYKFPGEDTDG